MLCVAYVASRGKRTMAAVLHELKVWRAEGVETGEPTETVYEAYAKPALIRCQQIHEITTE